VAIDPAGEIQAPVALVTGGTSGIGRAVAGRLAADGFDVWVHGRDAARGQQVVDAIRSREGLARFAGADLTDPEGPTRLLDAVGEVDVLVNNAGFSWFGKSGDLDVATFDRLFAANVRAAYYLVAGLAPGMASRGQGSIVNLGSMAGQIGLAGGAAYGATKAALAAMTRSWAAEFAEGNVRVNTVAPGPVFSEGADADRTEALGASTLLRRAAHVDEIADVVSFLVSPGAGYITGAVIPADGGRTAA
jgi:NAD(P)-dependent dehydrogenase (short-subunit alcohol dehydrogenase family)